jgi:hypothetical protein
VRELAVSRRNEVYVKKKGTRQMRLIELAQSTPILGGKGEGCIQENPILVFQMGEEFFGFDQGPDI